MKTSLLASELQTTANFAKPHMRSNTEKYTRVQELIRNTEFTHVSSK